MAPATTLDTTLTVPPRVPVRAVIQCAMDIETEPFLNTLTERRKAIDIGTRGPDSAAQAADDRPTGGRQTFTLGTLDGQDVLIVTSGIGLANAASATARALMLVRPEVVLIAGTCGGLAARTNVGDVMVGTSTLFNAADASAFGYAPGQIPNMPPLYEASAQLARTATHVAGHVSSPVHQGLAISGDAFVTAWNVGDMRERFPQALTTDMETAAVAEVAWSSGVDWLMMRAISDLCGPAADQEFHMDADRAAALSGDAVRALLKLL